MSILNRIQTSAIDFLTAALIAALVVVVPAPLFAQQSAVAQKPAVKAAPQVDEENEAPSARKPGDEGIKVHGHWIIDVKDKDGKIVEHRDFQNALAPTQGVNPGGGALLASLLTGQATVDQLYIYMTTTEKPYWLSGSTSYASFTCTDQGGNRCFTGLTQQLTAPYSTNYAIGSGITLTGQIQAFQAMSINSVSTNTIACIDIAHSGSGTIATSTVPASACTLGFQGTNGGVNGSATQIYGFAFTSKDISAAPLSVAAGQTVQVTVTISFS